MRETVVKTIQIKYCDKEGRFCTGIDKENSKKLILYGKLPHKANISIKAMGYISGDKKNVFNVESWSYDFAIDTEVFLAYAETLPGIGPKTALKIFHKYGVDYGVFSSEVLLKKVVPKNKIESIIEQNKKDNTFESAEFIQKLIKTKVFSNRKITQISSVITEKDFYENPFLVMKKIKISYSSLNNFCLSVQKEYPHLLALPERLTMGVEKTLSVCLSCGDCFLYANRFIEKSLEFLNNGVENEENKVSEEKVKEIINNLNKAHKIRAEISTDKKKLRIYNSFYFDCENFVADSIYKRLNKSRPVFTHTQIQSAILKTERKYRLTLADTQKLAIETIINNNIAIITGSAGTGKTTVLKFAIDVFEQLIGGDIILVAPTGRAARRMTESTAIEASTLHSLLKIGVSDEEDDSDVFVSDEKIEGEAIFVDETSMCDISIIYRLFQHLSENCRVYFLGDVNQLQSVGSGNVLDDLIESYYVPTVKLSLIYRQSQDSNIIYNANNILNGIGKIKTGDDFVVYNISNPEKIAEQCCAIYKQELQRLGDILDVQCITPKRVNGILASEQLNKQIQMAINPNYGSNSFFFSNGYKFYIGDKIICNKNTETVRNGDIGVVTNVTKNEIQAIFDTGEEIFDAEQAEELNISLAYCITVHKSQGSEFKTVFIPVSEENKAMLKRNLFYTAVTRAKEKMIIVGENKYIKSAIEEMSNDSNEVIKIEDKPENKATTMYFAMGTFSKIDITKNAMIPSTSKAVFECVIW